MKKFLFAAGSVLFSLALMCGCGKDDPDARDNYVGDFTGTRHTTSTINNSFVENDNTCTLRVRKNEGNSKSIVVYPTTTKDLLFYTEDMKFVKIDGADAYCGAIKGGTIDNEDGSKIVTEAVNISEKIPYSCAIISDKDGKYILMYSYKTITTTTYDTEVIYTDSFTGTK
ncbi:MAG: hypothetical protein IKI25_02820 [Bacteroidales bacterium]|nr:hypothetical protein [Bacteroidales bacterium]